MIFCSVREEVYYRWFIFLVNIIFIKTINFWFFGWMGFGIWEFAHNYIFGPICNLMTLGYLQNYLVNKELWFVGASILTTNILFRDGHSYQGYIGWINSWCLGILFFWVTLNYGLLAAIFSHSIYNIVVTIADYLSLYLHPRLNPIIPEMIGWIYFD